MSEYQKNGVLGTEQSTSNKVRISGRWTSPNAGSAYVFPGLIDEVKIYNYARTPAQIKADYENTKAYFPGGSSSPAFVGADCISPQSGTCDVPLQFDGVDDYLTLGPGTIGRELSGAVASSVSMWIKPVSFPTAGNNFQLIGAVINGAYAGPVDYKINADHTIAVGGRSTGADSHQNLNSIGTINANEWTHILGVLNFTGDSITIYINGNLDNTSAKTFGSNTYSPGTPSGPDMIGNFYNTSRFFKGSIAGVKIFDYALSADQVKTQYASGIDGSGAGSGGSFGEDSGEARLAPTDGLVGHWKLDGDANDASGNSNNGILYGDTTFTSGKLGQAGSFDGTGDYVSVADSSTLSPGSSNYAIAVWFKTSSAASQPRLVSNYGSSANNLATLMLNSDGKPICTYRDGSSNAATVSGLGSDLANGTWHQGVCVKDNKTAILYIDGVRLGENTNASMGAIDTTGLAKTFGTNSATPATNLLTGQIDDVRIYNRALSAVEIENLYRSTANEVINSTDAIVNTATDGSFDGTDDIQRDTTVTAGLVGWWAMDEVSGSYAYDRSGNGNTGTATGTTVVTGKLGRGRDFNGTSDVVSISDSTSLDITPNITISTWVKLDSVSASYQNFVAKRGSGGFPSNYFLRTGGSNNSDPDEIQFGYYNGSYRVVSTTTANLTTGNWYHVVATHDNSSEKVYINGVQYSTVWRWGTSSTSLLADNETLAIGRGGSMNGEYTDGTIDDVRIYNRALSPSEIQTIYAEGQKAITGSVSVSADVKPSVIGSTAVGGMVAGKGSNYELGTIGGIGGTGARSSFTTNAITTQLSGTSINDVYFYDTTLDTDYGTGKSTDPLVWRFDSSKSWYTETIDATYAACNVSTNDRCGTKYFPEKSYIVATDTGNESTSYVYIFDAESNAMWMRFDQWGGVASIHFMIPGTFVTSVFMLDGTFYAGLENYSGRYGVTTANFVNDTGVLYRGDDHVGNWNGNIGVRNTSGYDHVDTGTAIHDILAANVNDVHAAVINGKTYVAVATADGWSLINETDGTVASDTSGYSVRSIFISKDGELYTLLDSGGPHFKLYAYYNAQNLGPGTISYGLWNYTYSNTTAPYIPTSGYELINLNVTEGTSTIDGTSNTIYVGTTSNGAIVLQEKQTDETNGSVKYVTSDYISEEMVGDIRGMWPMYEGSVGATVDEVSVKNADLTVVSTPTVADGVRGNALDFDGSTDYLAQTPVEEYDESHTDVDVGIWYDTSSKRHAQGIQVPSTTSVGTVRLWMKKVGSPTNYLRVELQTDSSGTPSNTPVTNGTSTCIAQSTLSTSSSWVGFKFATAPSLSASTQYHIVAKAFTDSGCTTEQSSFNQTNYTRWGLDQSGITYTDGLRSSYGTSWTSVADQAFAFEIYNNNFDITGNLTVGAWVKTSSWIEEKKVIAKWPSSGNDRGYILVAGSSGTASKPRFIVYIGGNSQAEASTSLANDTWHYLVGVYNGSSVKLYVNGVESASTNTSGSINNSSMPLTIGSDGAGGGIWNGTIDEPFVTAEALSADQIKHMYDVGYAALQSSGQGINKLNGSSNQVNAVAATGLSIRTDSVGAMHASPGILYAGSEGGGVSKIDLSSDTLVNAFSTGTPWVINHANVNALTPTTGGNFVAALDSGVSRLNDVSGRSDLSSTSYTHVSAVYDKITGYYYLYEGGKLVAKTNVGTSHSPVTDTNPFTIGAASVSTLVAPSIPLSIIQNQKSIFYFHFYGGIKNVSVHSSALDARTISYAANNSIDPVLHLSFDEGQGTVAHNAQWENVGTTTNLVTNPSFETDLTSWVTANGGTWTQDSTSSVQGNYSLKGVTTDNLQGKVFDLTGLTEGTVLSVSASLRAESGSARFYASDGDWSNAVISSLHTSSDWVRYTINKTVPSSGAIKIVLLGSTGGGTLYFDGVQLTQTSSATPYCDGSLLGNGSYSWNGTAHASTSTCTYGTDGTVHGATWQKDGAKNGSLSFDGTNDYVSVPNQESIDISGDITLSAWVKRDSGSREESIIGKYGNTPRDGYLLYITSADKASFTLATADTAYGVASTTSISSGNWFYVTGVKHGTTARVYVNGVLENSTTVGANLDTSTLSLLIGDTSSGVNNKFDGSIDEVKIYPYALTTTEIKNLFNAGGGSTALGTPSGQDDTTPALSFGASNEYCVPGSSDPCDAPVAEWKMDENQGSTVMDTSGNGNNGAITGATWQQAGCKEGGCLGFGTGANLEVQDSSTLDTASAYTVSAWTKILVHNDSLNHHVLAKGSSGANIDSTYKLYYLDSQGLNAYRFTVGDGVNSCTATSTTTFNGDTSWHYLTGLWDSATDVVKIYVDGREDGTNGCAGVNTVVDSTNPLYISANPTGGATTTVNGQIDSVKIYNYARTPAQIAWDYNKGAPVAHYQFDECEGTTAYDASGNGNNGTITIGATVPQTSAGNCDSGDTTDAWYNGATGKWNSSMSFDGVDDYVSVTDPSDGSLDFGTSDFSISTWIKISEVSGHLIQKYQDNNINYELYVSSNGSVNLRTWTAGTLRDYVYSNASVITQGTWYHVVVVASRGTATTMYVDGKNVTSTQGTTTVDLSNSGALNMMWNKLGTDDKTSGQIDDVRIYNYALTAEQVKNLYNNNSAIRFE